MNRKVIGASILGVLAIKAVSRHHGMGRRFGPGEPGMVGGHGPWGGHSRHARRLDANDPRREWIREFHRSLHEEDEAEAATAGSTAGTAGDATPSTNPGSAD